MQQQLKTPVIHWTSLKINAAVRASNAVGTQGPYCTTHAPSIKAISNHMDESEAPCVNRELGLISLCDRGTFARGIVTIGAVSCSLNFRKGALAHYQYRNVPEDFCIKANEDCPKIMISLDRSCITDFLAFHCGGQASRYQKGTPSKPEFSL